MHPDEKDAILDYELQVYFCEGTESEKLEWFKTINIAGEKLTDQEIRNAVFAGTWTAEAKKIFSKSNCAAKLLSEKYVSANPIRQELLEKALSWFAGKDDKLICAYMGKHQHDKNANELWLYFQTVIAWVKATFVVYRKEMKGIEWGPIYNQFGSKAYEPEKLEKEICTLIDDDEVTNYKGIYYYLFDRKESFAVAFATATEFFLRQNSHNLEIKKISDFLFKILFFYKKFLTCFFRQSINFLIRKFLTF